MDGFLKQSTATQARTIGPFISDTDFKTPATALTIANTDVKLRANGTTLTNKNSGGATHQVNGEYSLTWDATDTANVGELTVSVNVAGALVVRLTYTVLTAAVYDQMFGSTATGAVPIAADGLALASIKADAYPVFGIVDSGTAQSATGTTVVLRSAATFANDTLIGMTIAVFGSTQGYWQTRLINSNVGSTDTVTVDTWTVTPSGTITYEIFATPPSSSGSPQPVNCVQWAGTPIDPTSIPVGIAAGAPNGMLRAGVNSSTEFAGTSSPGLKISASGAGVEALDITASGAAGIAVGINGSGAGAKGIVITSNGASLTANGVITLSGAITAGSTVTLGGNTVFSATGMTVGGSAGFSASNFNVGGTTTFTGKVSATDTTNDFRINGKAAGADGGLPVLSGGGLLLGYTISTCSLVGLVNALANDSVSAAAVSASAAAEIGGAVWDVVLASHLGAGTTGLALNSASSAGDPWNTALPAAYAAGTAGHIIGTALPDIAPGLAGSLLRAGPNTATTFANLAVTSAFTANTITVAAGFSTNTLTVAAGTTLAGAVLATHTGNDIHLGGTQNAAIVAALAASIIKGTYTFADLEKDLAMAVGGDVTDSGETFSVPSTGWPGSANTQASVTGTNGDRTIVRS